jgi:hypothetical protein
MQNVLDSILDTVLGWFWDGTVAYSAGLASLCAAIIFQDVHWQVWSIVSAVVAGLLFTVWIYLSFFTEEVPEGEE